MKIIVIGAVAAGTSAAAKARRNDETAEIIIYEKDSYISYSGCGMPYFIEGIVKISEELTPRDAKFFKDKYNIDVFIRHEVIDISPENKTIQVKDLAMGNTFIDSYDKLILATGAAASIPKITGIQRDNIFCLRNINDMHKINSFMNNNKIKNAVIIGTGFIGIEMCESLSKRGIKVTLIERMPHVTPILDPDLAVYVHNYLQKNGVIVHANTGIKQINEQDIMLDNNLTINYDLIILATGVVPNVTLAKNAGIELGTTGAIKVDSAMQTSIKDIYACGDCTQQINLITNKPIYAPLGSTANKTGRIAGDAITGGTLRNRGILGTGIFRLFDMTIAKTGLSEREAILQGYEIELCHNIKPDKPEYMGGKEMVIKAIANKANNQLLGVQIVGFGGVDKRIDVFATALTYRAKVEDLFYLDLAYAPPFSTTKDPVIYTGMILTNALHNNRPLLSSNGLDAVISSNEPYNLIDTRAEAQYDKAHIDFATNIPLSKLRNMASKLDKNRVTITYCNKGVTGNAAQNILINQGFKRVYNLSGGHKQYSINKNK